MEWQIKCFIHISFSKSTSFILYFYSYSFWKLNERMKKPFGLVTLFQRIESRLLFNTLYLVYNVLWIINNNYLCEFVYKGIKKKLHFFSVSPFLWLKFDSTKEDMDPGRSPCPYRLIDDTGGAFLIGLHSYLVIML